MWHTVILVWVSWQDWISGTKGPVTPPGHTGLEYFRGKETVPSKFHQHPFIFGTPMPPQETQHGQAKCWFSILSQPLPLHVHGMEEVFLYCNLNFKISWCINGNVLKWISCCLSLCFFGQHYHDCWAGHNVVISVRFIRTISGWSVLGEAF